MYNFGSVSSLYRYLCFWKPKDDLKPIIDEGGRLSIVKAVATLTGDLLSYSFDVYIGLAILYRTSLSQRFISMLVLSGMMKDSLPLNTIGLVSLRYSYNLILSMILILSEALIRFYILMPFIAPVTLKSSGETSK